MSTLAGISFAMAAACVLLALPCLAAPGAARALARRFPRSAAAGWFLTALDIGWVIWIVKHAALGRFEHLRAPIYILAPVAVVLVAKYMDELLAPRALGGLLLLIPTPVLGMVRWSDSGLRLVVVVCCYLLVLAGMALVLGPYHFRKFTAWWIASDGRCRAGGAALLAAGAALAAVGLLA